VTPEDLIALDRAHIWHPFTQSATAAPPVPIVRGQGATLYAADGTEYLDLISSWWVNLHGHAHPAITAAIANQAARLEHVIFADFTHEPAVRLAQRLARALPAPLSRVFFSDNGSTAVEAALKLAWQYWRNQGQPRSRFIAFAGGYHGDTVGAMSTGVSSGFFRAWADMLFPVDIAPFPETWGHDPDVAEKEQSALSALAMLLEQNKGQTAAIIIEPLLQGASGMRLCRPEFLAGVRKLADAADCLLIFDEVMTGFGRTGALFACQTAAVVPDMICLSKGLTGGFLPMAVTVCRERIYEAFLSEKISDAFLHGHSYTANPLGCAAALASLDLLEAPDCTAARARIADVHAERLYTLPGVHPRHCGTIAALDIPALEDYGNSAGEALKLALLSRGLLVRPLGKTLYFLPPYCIGEEDLHRAYDGVAEVLGEAGYGLAA
jgi:adenosylmethionine-8-amino-7-oxononanoate aminotransferase